MTDKCGVHLELVKEVREDLKELRSDVKDIKESQMRQGSDIRRNADSLEEHMRRTHLLEESVQVQTGRIDELETPNKLRKQLFDWFIKIGLGASGAIGIIKLISYFKS